MKKYSILCFLCLCVPGLSLAQLYLKGYTGYAFSTGNEKLTSFEEIHWREYPAGKYIYENNASSYQLKLGQGVNLGLCLGYALNKNIAFEITGNTQLFSTFNYSKPYLFQVLGFTREDPYGWSWNGIGFFGDLEYTNTLFQVSPQIVFRSNPYNQWSFYLKGGPDFMKVTHKRTVQNLKFGFFDVATVLSTTKFSGNINTGIQCSFGTEYKLSKNICIFAELTAVGVRYTFKKYQDLRYEIDEIDSLSTLGSTVSDEWDDKTVFNHAGLNVGIKYNFR